MNKLSRTKNLPIIVAILLIVALVALVPLMRPATTQALAQEEIYYCDNGYAGSGGGVTVIETINYATKQVVSSASLNSSFPAYLYDGEDMPNPCAPIAGANLIGYFDRFYEALIPNCSPGRLLGSTYRYTSMQNIVTQVQTLIGDLYVSMGTDTVELGTTQPQYKAGLTSYVNSKNLSISFESVMTNGALDMSKVHQAINNGKAISLYLSGYNSTTMSDINGVVTLQKNESTGTHIMIVYGYQIVNYYNASGALVTSKTYLNVSTGLSDSVGYYILNNNGLLVTAEASAIY